MQPRPGNEVELWVGKKLGRDREGGERAESKIVILSSSTSTHL